MADAREDLQRIARLVEANRERLESLEQQMRRLESVKMDQMSALSALEDIPDEGKRGSMVPLGAGVQIITDIPADGGAVVDIGSGIQAERTREEAKAIISTRNQELESLMDRMRSEFDELEAKTIQLATEFNEKITVEEEVPQPPPTEGAKSGPHGLPRLANEAEKPATAKKPRRRRGTDLTLDD